MNNIRPNQLKTAIFLDFDEYQKLVNTLFPHTHVHCETDGLWYEREEGLPEFENGDLYAAMAKHFDVYEVSSVHIDDCDYVGVWIVYKEHKPAPQVAPC